jgi:hypothetical protein
VILHLPTASYQHLAGLCKIIKMRGGGGSLLLTVLLPFVQFGVLQLYVLLQRTFGPVTPVAELGQTVVFPLDLLGCSTGTLAALPLRIILALLHFLLRLFDAFGLVQRYQLCLDWGGGTSMCATLALRASLSLICLLISLVSLKEVK